MEAVGFAHALFPLLIACKGASRLHSLNHAMRSRGLSSMSRVKRCSLRLVGARGVACPLDVYRPAGDRESET
jgi:hypothetical protein